MAKADWNPRLWKISQITIAAGAVPLLWLWLATMLFFCWDVDLGMTFGRFIAVFLWCGTCLGVWWILVTALVPENERPWN